MNKKNAKNAKSAKKIAKSKLQTERQWLPNFSELIDRLTIHQLKEVFIPEHKEKFRREMSNMVHDLDLMIQDKKIDISGDMIRAIIVVSQINAHIWYNESKARQGKNQDLSLLKLTHGLNGIRNSVGNILLDMSKDTVDRRDYKTDCLAAEHSQWDIQMNLTKTH